MFGMARKEPKGYESCSACGVCLPSCPAWLKTRDLSRTRPGRAKALQNGASPEEIAQAIDDCILCGACEPACPEEIPIKNGIIVQRRELNKLRKKQPSWYPDTSQKPPTDRGQKTAKQTLFLAGKVIGADAPLKGRILSLLGGEKKVSEALDDGQDICRFFEAGIEIGRERIEFFLAPLGKARKIIAAEGMIHHLLKEFFPHKAVIGLGEALLGNRSVRSAITSDDLYVIESRFYHADYERLVRFYNSLAIERGCQTSLDLQRMAIPTGASSLQGSESPEETGCLEQARWIIKGKRFKRIIVEDLADLQLFREVSEVPVVHLGELGSA
jgi:ferredoxin